jgi:uncharacterized membrane protein YgcG
MKRELLNLFLLLFVLNAGCKIIVPGENVPSAVYNGNDGGSNEALKIQVDENGGELVFEQMRIKIPEDALSEDTEIGIRVVETPVPFPDTYAPVSYVYECTPHGLKFAEPVEIEILYEDETERPHFMLKLSDEDDETWETVELKSHDSYAVTIEVNRFSFFAVVYEIEKARSKPDRVPTEEDAGVSTDAGVSDAAIAFEPFVDSGSSTSSDGGPNSLVGTGGSSGNGSSGSGGTVGSDDDAGR